MLSGQCLAEKWVLQVSSKDEEVQIPVNQNTNFRIYFGNAFIFILVMVIVLVTSVNLSSDNMILGAGLQA